MKEIDPGLHSLQAEVGGDIAASYPFSDPWDWSATMRASSSAWS